MKRVKVSRSDVAALWLNMVKILIGLVFVYQETLHQQLKMDLFDESSFYAFSASQNAQSGKEEPVVSADRPFFNLAVLPLSLNERYNTGRVEVAAVHRVKAGESEGEAIGAARLEQEGLLRAAGGTFQESFKKFKWPAEQTNGHALQLLQFNLVNLVKPGPRLRGGRYMVLYRVKFYGGDDAEPIQCIPASHCADVIVINEEGNNYDDKYALEVEFREEKEKPYGEIIIVRGQSAEFPTELRGLPIVARNTGTQDSQSQRGARAGNESFCNLIEIDNAKSLFTINCVDLSTDDSIRNTCKFRGSHPAFQFVQLENGLLNATIRTGSSSSETVVIDVADVPLAHLDEAKPGDFFTIEGQRDDEARTTLKRWKATSIELRKTATVDFTLTFVLQDNLPPRLITPLSKTYLYFNTDLYDDYDKKGDIYDYYNLSRYIVDPDAPDGSLLPRAVSVANSNFSIVKAKSTYRLRLADNYLPKEGDSVIVSASDNCSTKSFTFVQEEKSVSSNLSRQ